MKKMKFTVLLLCGALLLGSCGTMNNKAKGGIIGGGSGAAAGRADSRFSSSDKYSYFFIAAPP